MRLHVVVNQTNLSRQHPSSLVLVLSRYTVSTYASEMIVSPLGTSSTLISLFCSKMNDATHFILSRFSMSAAIFKDHRTIRRDRHSTHTNGRKELAAPPPHYDCSGGGSARCEVCILSLLCGQPTYL